MVDESVLSALTEARNYRWWLAPQIAESAWPNRGMGPATAALKPGAVIPSFNNRFRPSNFRPLDTSAGNSHIELGEQPFDFSATGQASFAIAFRYNGVGGSTFNPKLLETRKHTGCRVLIHSSNQIWIGMAGSNSVSGTLGPITPGEDYVFIFTFTGEQVLTASVHDMAGTVLFELERSVAGLGDATPNRNATVFGSTASNYVSGELGDVIIDSQSAWSANKRKSIATALNIRPSINSAYRSIWEAGELPVLDYSFVTPEMFRASAAETDDAVMFRAALDFTAGQVPLIASGTYLFESVVDNFSNHQIVDISNATITLPDGHQHNAFYISAIDDVEMKLGTFKTNPGSVSYPVRVSSCSRFKSSGGRFYNTLGTVAYYNSTDCVSYDIWSHQTKYGGNIQSGCKDTGFVNAIAINSLEHGYYLAGSQGLEIVRCYLDSCVAIRSTVNAFKVASHCRNCSVIDGVARDASGDGIYIWQNVTGAHVKGNEVDGAGGHGISLWHGNAGGAVQDSLVHDNLITGSSGSGIRTDFGDSNNEFWSNRSKNNGAADSFLDTAYTNTPI